MKKIFDGILVLIKNHKFNESIEQLNKLMNEDKNNFDYYYLKGISYLNLTEFNHAIENLSSAINIKDDNFITYHFRGISYLKVNKINEAKKDFNKLISLKSDFSEAYNNLGFVLFKTGENKEAIKNFTKSIKLNKNFKQAISSLIIALSYTENVETNNLEIISTHNKINEINFDYSSSRYLDNEDIKKKIQETNDLINKDLENLDFNMTQIYRRHASELNCKRHKKIFNTHGVIPEFCFGCYKVQIEPDNVIDLIKLYILFDNINLENKNLRKCMIEFRPNIKGKYKGLIYCNSLNESERVQNQLLEMIKINFNKKLPCKIKRGCTEFEIKYPKYDDLTNEAIKYDQEWKKYETLIDEKNPDLFFKKIIKPSIKGISLNDILIIRNWLAYAKIIGDESYKDASDQVFYSSFIEKKLKLRIL